MADRGTVADEHVQHRHLVAVGRLPAVVPIEVVLVRGQQLQVAPAALLGVVGDAPGIGLRDHGEVQLAVEVASRAVEGVEHRGARGARALVQRQPGGPPLDGPRPGVARVAREHEVVGDQRVLLGGEQGREADLAGGAPYPLEDVVLGHDPAGWQRPPLGGHPLGRAA